ncbi:MAG: TetR/AcrR family transcriptional regulator [Alphaproteobacteria bacterium]
MARKQQKDPKVKIIDAALSLAAERGWDRVTLADIAVAAKLSLAALHEHFEDKNDILAGLGRVIDRRVLEAIGTLDDSVSPRDRLFEILMERFDVLSEYRTGLVPILNSFQCDPKQFVINLPHLCKSMNWMLELAGLNTNGIAGSLRLVGMTGLYIRSLQVWLKDESPDMGKTMAALDRDLGRIESLAKSIGL